MTFLKNIKTREQLSDERSMEELKPRLEEAMKYLLDTDFYYFRHYETGESIPQEVVEKRIKCREFIRSVSTEPLGEVW